MITKNKERLIIVISSPSGAGKTSVCKKLIERDKSIGLSISDTTRPARDNEKSGIDYNFISEDQFKANIDNNAYVEHAVVFGNYYGSLRNNIINHFEKGRDILFDIDWQGAAQLKKSNFSNMVYIFITPPSKEIIHQRLKSRAKTSGDNINTIDIRMSEYETEMSHKDSYDYVVINEELDVCISQIEEIISSHRKNLIY